MDYNNRARQKMLPFAGLFKGLREDALRITWQRVLIVLLAAICAVVYVPYLANPLVFDDQNLFGNPNFIDYTFQFLLAPRWLPYATLAHTHVITDGSIAALRIGNLLLHAANVALVFVLLREMCIATSSDTDARHGGNQALIVASTGAALYAVHPIAVYAVGYVAQRTILMSTLFVLLMLIAYLRWLTTGRTALWVWSAVWYLLSVFSKEHSVAAPAAAFLLTWVVHRPSVAWLRRLIVPFALYAAIALLTVSMLKGVLGVAYEPHAVDMVKQVQGADVGAPALMYLRSVVTQTLLFFKYMFLWIFPDVRWMSLDIRVPMASSLFDWPYAGAATGFVCYAVVVAGMVLRGGRVGMAGWILMFPWIMFAPELSTVRIQEPFVLYRAYLWFPLFGALVPLALTRWNAKLTLMLLVPTLCVLVLLSWNRLHSLSDGLLTWQDAAKLLVTGHEAGADRIYYNRALALSGKNRHQEALADLDRTVALNAKLAPVFFTRATTNYRLNRHAEALKDINTSLELDPTQSSAYLARATVFKKLGRDEEALVDMRKSCEMKNVIACYAMSLEKKPQPDSPR